MVGFRKTDQGRIGEKRTVVEREAVYGIWGVRSLKIKVLSFKWWNSANFIWLVSERPIWAELVRIGQLLSGRPFMADGA